MTNDKPRADELLALAHEFDGEAKAHRAMGDDGEARKCKLAAAALRAPMIVTEVTAVVALGWLHEIIEPDGRSAKMYSASPNNPWGQWVKQYADQCKYKCTTLYAFSTPVPENQNPDERLKPLPPWLSQR